MEKVLLEIQIIFSSLRTTLWSEMSRGRGKMTGVCRFVRKMHTYDDSHIEIPIYLSSLVPLKSAVSAFLLNLGCNLS